MENPECAITCARESNNTRGICHTVDRQQVLRWCPLVQETPHHKGGEDHHPVQRNHHVCCDVVQFGRNGRIRIAQSDGLGNDRDTVEICSCPVQAIDEAVSADDP